MKALMVLVIFQRFMFFHHWKNANNSVKSSEFGQIDESSVSSIKTSDQNGTVEARFYWLKRFSFLMIAKFI